MKQSGKLIFRVALFWAAFWLLLTGLQVFPPLLPQSGLNLLMGCLLVVGSMLLVMFFLKSERRKPGDVGLEWESGTLPRLFVGTLCGMATVTVMMCTLAIYSSITISQVPEPDYWNATGYAALVLFLLAFMEEVAFRSYPLVRLSEAFGVRASVYTTSIVFAFYHGLHPGNLLGPGVWGLFFGLAAIKTKGIAFPAGLHFGLNWMQSLFGMKPQYASSVWTVNFTDSSGLFSSETVGIALQILLLILGVYLIERYVRRQERQIKKPVTFAV